MKHQYQLDKSSSKILFLVGVLSLLVASVQGDDYLKEAPSFFKACSLSDPNNGVCLAKAFEVFYTHWRDGIPGLKNFGSIDPFHVKKIHLEQNNPNINFKMDLKDVIITGLGHATIAKASLNGEYNFKLLTKVPQIQNKGNYRMKGSILLLRLDSTGLMDNEVSNVDVVFSLKTQLIEVNGQKFFDVTGIQTSIKNIDNFHINFTNLFDGNKELEDSANDVFNQNWRELFEIMRPALEETLDAIALDRYKKIFTDFIVPCYLEDPQFNKCYAKNFEGIYREWKDGLPGFKEAGSYDPLYVKRVVIAQDANNPVALNAELINLVITGVSQMQVQDASFNPKSLKSTLKLFVPKLRFDSDYKLKGRILNLALNGNGKALIDIDNFVLILNIQLKLRDEHGLTFTDIDKLHLEIKDVGGFHVHFDNLFNGQKDLEDTTNAVFNDNWRDFYEVLRPAIRESVEFIMKDRLSKAYGYVPGNYFIADVPSAAQHSGVPGLKAAGSFDPLYVKRIIISQDPNNQLALNADLSNVVITGASKMKVQEIKFDIKTLSYYAKILAPKLRLDFDYKLNGRILNLPLKSNGKAFMEVENFVMVLKLQVKLRDDHGFTFTDIEKLHMDIKDVGGFHVYFDNLFNGQKDLEDSINGVFNENWREFYQIEKPAITTSVQEIMKDRLSKVFSYVPGNYFIADIPSAAQYNGIPGYKAAGSFDPIYVKHILFSQDPKNPVALNVDLSNVVITGASNIIVQEISFDAKALVLHAKLLVPKLQFTFDYKINGQILNLVLKSHGKGFFEIENLGMILNVQLKLRDEHDFTFADVEKLHMSITDIGGVRTHFDNLFNGQRDLEDSTNTLINENWRDFYEILRPAVTEAVQEIMKDRLKKSLGYVPISYFIEDLPTAAEHSADILIPCQLQDENFSKCFGRNFQVIFHEWKDGIPGFKEAGSFDPLYVKRIVIAQDDNNPLAINADLKNMIITGVSGIVVKDAHFNPNTLFSKIKLFVPKLRFDSDYKLKGRIINLAINGNGKAFFEVENFTMLLNIQLRLRDEHGYTFSDIDKLKLDILEVGGFRVRFDNLFNGQEVLEESTNAVFNENWRDFFEVLRPAITGSVEAVMKDRLAKAYGYIPANYFIEDIPSAVEHRASYLKPCKIYQPGFTACSTENTQRLLTQLGKGVPEINEIIGSIDPIKLKEINFKQDNTEAASLRADLSDLTATGIKGLVIKESKVSKKDFSWLTKIFIPKFKLEGHYKMDGRVLLLPLNGEGHFVIEIDDMDIIMRTKTHLIEKGGFTFYNITSIKVDLEISKLRTQFDDLFGGNNKEIERSTNESFNKNWKEFFEALRPLINETVERVLFDILHPVFSIIPANFMIEDIPSPEKFYGSKQ
ncbi:hypothetical protein FF38_00427 [Lucilia cuprina]|uniref:Protein takeout n=1 Tax=Lucilia cuprina TaxID=7375 RepID=A0A0L0BMU2_LUCCU|nr:hypothetical protein FF38_00427 [Lucilia cuprina]